MKKLTWLLSAVLFVAACSPQVYPLHLGVRQPSESGLTLVGKTASIVYMDGNNQVDSLFDRQVASALARALEADYFNGQEVIGLSRIASPDSVGTDLMHNLVMETGGDVIFLLNSSLGALDMQANKPVSGATSVDSAYVAVATMPVQTHLYVYDSMDKDEVKLHKGKAILKLNVFNSGITSEDGLKTLAMAQVPDYAEEVGDRISRRFLSTWSNESFSFYYFEDYSSESWFTPLQHAADEEYAKAIDGWALMVKEGSSIKRACACFNIAQTFFLMGDYKLSARWLDEAEKLENLSQAPALRKRLVVRLEK
jgi:hypothetical protein